MKGVKCLHKLEADLQGCVGLILKALRLVSNVFRRAEKHDWIRIFERSLWQQWVSRDHLYNRRQEGSCKMTAVALGIEGKGQIPQAGGTWTTFWYAGLREWKESIKTRRLIGLGWLGLWWYFPRLGIQEWRKVYRSGKGVHFRYLNLKCLFKF